MASPIIHFSDISVPISDKNKKIQADNANYSKYFGFNRLGIHHVVLKPGFRSSVPHAESHEEEFVYVISGEVHVWINGYIYKIGAGWAAGFPAGSGIIRTFINNSAEAVQLLVVGERSKSENRFIYPVDQEIVVANDKLWREGPEQEMGPHNGLPGEVRQTEIKTDYPPCLIYAPNLIKKEDWHYPGDNETFDDGVRLTDALGLKVLGIWCARMPEGRRSCYPHAHTHQEEFCFILSGTPQVWLDGNTHSLKVGDAVGFVPNTGISHCLINDDKIPAYYIGIGEAVKFQDEKLIYPMNPFRESEGLRSGWLWSNPPFKKMGPHTGRALLPPPRHLQFRLGTEKDAIEVFKIYKASPKYFQSVDGCEPTYEMALREIVSKPTKQSQLYFKEFLILEFNGESIGVMDLHCHHPEQDITYIGLLLIAEKFFGQGLGGECYRLAEDYIKRVYKSNSIRLGVSHENDVSGYWMAMGYKPNGRTYTWQGENKTTNVTEFEKSL